MARPETAIATTLYYDILGEPVTVTVPDPDLRAAVTRVLSGFTPPAGVPVRGGTPYTLERTADGFWSVSRPGAGFNTNGDLTDALLALEWQLVMDALARRTDLFHLHGAALAAPDARTGLVIVGESGSGKTTLVLALLRAGFLPFSDDVALMEPETLMLRPFPRAFHVRQPSRPLLATLGMTAREFDTAPPGFFIPSRWATAPAPVRVVLFPSLRPEEPPRLVPFAPAESARALLAQTATLTGASRLALATAARLTARAHCYRLFSGDLTATVALITGVLRDLTANEDAP